MSNEPKYTADLILPKAGKQAWTNLMQGQAPVPDQINPGSPIVMAYARFMTACKSLVESIKGRIPQITTLSSCGFLTPTVINIRAGR